MNDVRFDSNIDLKIDDIGFIKVVRNTNYLFEYKNGKDRHSFIYVEKGSLEYSFLNKKLKVGKGELLFMPASLPYKTRYLADGTKIKILLFNTGKENLPFDPSLPFLKSSSDIQNIFLSFGSRNLSNSLFLTAKIFELLYLLSHENDNVPKKFKKILPAIEDINENYFENHKILYYAELCNMSEPNFRKLFREFLGKSPVEYRNQLRIMRVKRLLESGEFTVSEAAYLVGFNNMSFFYKEYSKYLTQR